MLDGYKSFITAGLMIVNGVLYGLTVYDSEVFWAVASILTGGAIYSIRDAIKKNNNNN